MERQSESVLWETAPRGSFLSKRQTTEENTFSTRNDVAVIPYLLHVPLANSLRLYLTPTRRSDNKRNSSRESHWGGAFLLFLKIPIRRWFRYGIILNSFTCFSGTFRSRIIRNSVWFVALLFVVIASSSSTITTASCNATGSILQFSYAFDGN